MAFAPIVPFGGVAGLRFLDRTYDAQFATFSRSPDVQRDIDYFLNHAGDAKTSADLVGDRRLLKVALGAFGLDDEADKGAFIRKILDEGTLDPKSLANRLADPAWSEFSLTLGYGDLGGLLGVRGVREDIVARYRQRQFEKAVGDSDVDMRLALSFRRQIGAIAGADKAGSTAWFKIMGSKSLRKVVETAYGLPAAFGQIDIDQQKATLEERTQKLYGTASPEAFLSAENVEDLLRRFLVNSQAANGPGPGAPGMTALTLLQSSGMGAGAQANLFASNL